MKRANIVQIAVQAVQTRRIRMLLARWLRALAAASMHRTERVHRIMCTAEIVRVTKVRRTHTLLIAVCVVTCYERCAACAASGSAKQAHRMITRAR